MFTIASQTPDGRNEGVPARTTSGRSRFPFPLQAGETVGSAQQPGATQPMVDTGPDKLATQVIPVRAPGQVYFGSYVLERRLGRGGVGEVWLARQTGDVSGPVALKFLVANQDPGAVEAMRKEIDHARRLNHPGLIRIFSHHHHGSEQAIAMEFVDGRNLAELAAAQEQGFLDPDRLAPWLHSLADALDYAHRHRVIHLDIKPSNLLVDRSDRIRLVDFGVACEFDPANTSPCYRGGTRAYMSPQQWRGEPPSPQDDIFSLGVTLYELLTRRLPFGQGGIGHNPDGKAPTPPSDVRQQHRSGPLPRGWDDAILACLDPDPSVRPKSMADLVSRLDSGVRTCRERRAALVAAALVVAGLLVMAGVVAWVLAFPGPVRNPRNEAPPAERSFTEDFRNGLGGWYTWGDPPPTTLREFRGRAFVLQAASRGGMPVGLTSQRELTAPAGLRLAADLLLLAQNPRGQYVQTALGITADGNHFPGMTGLGGDVGDGIRFCIRFDGAASSSVPEALRMQASYQATFLSESGTVVTFSRATHGDAAEANAILGRWARAEILVDAERTVRFSIDGRTIWSPAERLHPDVLVRQRVVVESRAVDAPGVVHVDDLAWSGAGEPMITPALTLHPAQGFRLEDIPLNAEAWDVAGTDPARLWAGSDSLVGLPLSSRPGDAARIQSRRVWSSPVAASFYVRPLLFGEDEPGRRVRVGMAADSPEGTPAAFVGVEFRRDTAYFVDETRPDTPPSVIGSCPPGRWYNVSVEVREGGVTWVRIGALLATSTVRIPEAFPGWRVTVEAAGGGDGLWIQAASAANGSTAGWLY